MRKILVIALLSAFAITATDATEKLKIGYAPGGGSILTFIAKDKNFFQQEGIDAELVTFSSSSDGLNALNAGKIDIGVSFGTGGPLTFITKGADFAIIGGHLSGGHPVIVKPDRAGEFKSIFDFKGKTVATPRLYTSDIVWRGALFKAGINPEKDINVIEMKKPQDVLEAVKSGKADVGIGTSSIYIKAKQAGLAFPLWSNDFFPNHPCCRIVARKKSIAADSKLYVGFLKAIIRAEKVFRESPEYAVDVNKRFLEISDAQSREFTLEPHQVIEADPNAKAVHRIWEEMKAIGYVKSDLNVNDYINTGLYRQALTELQASEPSLYYDRLDANFKEKD